MGSISNKLAYLLATKEAIKQAIVNKGIEVGDDVTFRQYADKIYEIPSGGNSWTGHADAEGLRAIGWTDDDIAYYQQNGVNWNESDDAYHKVTDDNKALYGVLTANNIQTYKDRIVYLPKIDTSSMTSMVSLFEGCDSLVALPLLNTTKVTNMNRTFYNCKSLVSIPLLDTQNVTTMAYTFTGCFSLVSIPLLNTQKVMYMESTFYYCHSLVSIPPLDTQNLIELYQTFFGCHSLVSIPQLNTPKMTTMYCAFYNCYSLKSIPPLNTQNVTNMYGAFYGCNSLVAIPQSDMQKAASVSATFYNCKSLVTANLKNVKLALVLNDAPKLSKESLLYIINNEAATSAITIQLASYAYTRLANDADVVAALANHPNISISQ